MKPQFRSPTYRAMRSASFAVLGLSAFIPVGRDILLNEWQTENQTMSIAYFLGLGLSNGAGTVIFAMLIPKRWYPKTFDIYGSSHQVMHVLVACGALSHATDLLRALDYWNTRKKNQTRVLAV